MNIDGCGLAVAIIGVLLLKDPSFTDTSIGGSMVKSELRMPAGTRHQYTEDFKREAVRLVRESAHPVAQVARDLGILEHVWSHWRTQHRPAKAHGPTPAAQRAEELTRMERARVTPKRDCLQCAAACFASTADAISSGSCAARSPCGAQLYPAFGNPSDPPRIPRDPRPSQHWGRPGQAGHAVGEHRVSRLL